MVNRIDNLIRDIRRDRFDGTGKPEPLQFEITNWSRRIDREFRLVFRVTDTALLIAQCRYRY